MAAVSPPLAPSTRAGMRIAVVEGCFSLWPQTFTSGVFLTGFALMLGAGPWSLGLLAAIPAAGQFSQLLAAFILDRWIDRKRLTVWGASIGRYLWLVIATLPFLPLPARERLGAFFVLMAAATVLGQLSGIAWCDWMADLVPETVRGRYFGLRNAINALCGMGAVWVGTTLLDQFKGHAMANWGFFWLFVIGGLGALGSQIALSMQPEVGRSLAPRTEGFALAKPLGDRSFLGLLAFMATWTLVANMVSPFCYPYALKQLQLPYATLGLHTMLTTALGIVCQPLWGRVIDRRGTRFVLGVCMAFVCLNPLFWYGLRADFLAPLWLDALFSGLFWSGLNLATFNLLMERSPAGDRPAYMSLFNASLGLASMVASFAAAGTIARLGGGLFGVPMSSWQELFVMGCALRIACYAVFRTTIARAPYPLKPSEAV